MTQLKYLAGYPEQLTHQIDQLLRQRKLGEVLLHRYPKPHEIKTDKALYDFTAELKNKYLRKAATINKVTFDGKIAIVHEALGLHTYAPKVQGRKIKTRNEIRIGNVFKTAPLEFLRMIVVHELAHLKEKEHNKAFYNLCEHMEPHYHQLEFDVRVYLTYLETVGPLY